MKVGSFSLGVQSLAAELGTELECHINISSNVDAAFGINNRVGSGKVRNMSHNYSFRRKAARG